MKEMEILSRKTVFNGHLFHIDEITFRRDGQIKTHNNILRDPTVSVFPISDSGEIYLAKQYRYLLEKETLEGIAGFIDPGEAPSHAAARELKEEAGIEANKWQELGVIDIGSSVLSSKAHLFLVKELQFGEQDLDEGEDIEIVKIPLKEAVAKVASGEITTSSSVIGILKIDRLQQEGKL
jgi:ADP-ribose pyrophosphatase